MIRLAHCWSSDRGIAGSAAYDAPLLERGWEVTHVTPPGPGVDLGPARGSRWLRHGLTRRFDPWGDLWNGARLYRTWRRERFEIVHTHHVKVGLVARVTAAAARTPIVVHTLHGLFFSLATPWLARAFHAACERVANRRVDAVLFQCREDAETLLRCRAVAPRKLEWIGNGVDLERFHATAVPDAERQQARRELGVEPDEVLFLSASRLVREKGIVELVAGAEAARREDRRVRLALAGFVDSGRSDAIDARLLAAAGRNGVLVLGHRDDMPRLYAACDAVVLASWREGLPRTLLEGAAMARPLLGTQVRGIREVIRPGENGLLAAERSAVGLAAGMLRLTRDPELRQRCGAHSAAEARAMYDVRQVAARVTAIYDRLLAEKALRGARQPGS